jgi:metallophosphoesterase (TIGR03767 family)
VKRGIAVAVLAGTVVATTGVARGHGVHSAQAGDPLGHTSVEQTIAGPDPAAGFAFLGPGPGEGYVVRQELRRAQEGRRKRRGSIAYFGQITDFQLADEESPARVEFFDIDPSATASSAWRPQEAMVAHQVEWTIRQMNRFRRSPVRQRGGKRARLLNAVMTGDLADNMQRNETEWVVRLLEGGTLNPNSGTTDLTGTACPPGTPLDDPAGYTGVQDYDDYLLDNSNFYDPDQPIGQYADWPTWPGLMDRAQQPFTAQGLKVPSYVAFGNHDGLVQGNEDANAAFEEVATGCVKPLQPQGPVNPLAPGAPIDALPPLTTLDPGYLAGVIGDPTRTMLVPPDPNRQFVDKRQFKELHDTGKQRDAHGFAYVDQAELDASAGAAAYYAFTPKRGVRYIVLDTVSEAGLTPESSDGNIDDPQFRWLEGELEAASGRDELIVVFGHHAATSMTANVPDEIAPPCVSDDDHGHDANPGCDRDPRSSQPIHLSADLTALLNRFPHVVTYVAGHSHENAVQPYERPGGGYWEIKSPAVVDWPPQHRLIEIMDNCDTTLSIFATLLDHGGAATAPAPGADASGFDSRTLASVGRTLSYNDPQYGFAKGAQGGRTDRNVELLINDPRTGDATVRSIRVRASRKHIRAGRRTKLRLSVTDGSGRALAGARVKLGGRSATTNARGRATLKVRLKGRTRLVRARASFPNACRPAATTNVRVLAAQRRRPARRPRRSGPRFTGKRALPPARRSG